VGAVQTVLKWWLEKRNDWGNGENGWGKMAGIASGERINNKWITQIQAHSLICILHAIGH